MKIFLTQLLCLAILIINCKNNSSINPKSDIVDNEEFKKFKIKNIEQPKIKEKEAKSLENKPIKESKIENNLDPKTINRLKNEILQSLKNEKYFKNTKFNNPQQKLYNRYLSYMNNRPFSSNDIQKNIFSTHQNSEHIKVKDSGKINKVDETNYNPSKTNIDKSPDINEINKSPTKDRNPQKFFSKINEKDKTENKDKIDNSIENNNKTLFEDLQSIDDNTIKDKELKVDTKDVSPIDNNHQLRQTEVLSQQNLVNKNLDSSKNTAPKEEDNKDKENDEEENIEETTKTTPSIRLNKASNRVIKKVLYKFNIKVKLPEKNITLEKAIETISKLGTIKAANTLCFIFLSLNEKYTKYWKPLEKIRKTYRYVHAYFRPNMAYENEQKILLDINDKIERIVDLENDNEIHFSDKEFNQKDEKDCLIKLDIINNSLFQIWKIYNQNKHLKIDKKNSPLELANITAKILCISYLYKQLLNKSTMLQTKYIDIKKTCINIAGELEKYIKKEKKFKYSKIEKKEVKENERKFGNRVFFIKKMLLV